MSAEIEGVNSNAYSRNGALKSRAGSITTAQTNARAPLTAIPTKRNGSRSSQING